MVAKAEFEAQEERVKRIGRPAGSSWSLGDDRRYQDWYRYGEIEGEFQILGAATLKLREPNDARTNVGIQQMTLVAYGSAV